MGIKNRLANISNPFQGDYRRVVCVCSAGLLRSPTAAHVLSKKPFNFNTRAVGCESYALIPLDEVLIQWSTDIVFMSKDHFNIVTSKFNNKIFTGKNLITWSIPDSYNYMEESLVKVIIAEAKRTWNIV